MSPSRRGTSVSFERTHAAAKQYVGLKQKQLCFSLRLRPEKISNIRRGNIQGWKRRRARSTERKFMLRHVDAEIYTDRPFLRSWLSSYTQYHGPRPRFPFIFYRLSTDAPRPRFVPTIAQLRATVQYFRRIDGKRLRRARQGFVNFIIMRK